MTIAVIAGGESTGATGEGESRHRRTGEHRHYRRKITGITLRGDHWYYRRGLQLAEPWRVGAGVTGGECAAVTEEARGGMEGTGGGVARGFERRNYRRGRLHA